METVIVYIYAALFGLVFGSFLNVCILRIPAGESIVSGASHCPKCGRRLGPHELIPVFSWLIQGGRCRGCKALISPQYPVIEAATALLWTLCVWLCGLTLALPLQCLFVTALLGLSVIDARTQEIPLGFNVFIGVLGVLRVALAIYEGGLAGALPHLIGAGAVFLPLLALYLLSGRRAIGGGDVKLMLVVGLFLGWQQAVLGFFIGCLLGSVIHMVRMRVSKAGRVLAMGPYLAAGLTLAMLVGEPILAWYLSFFMF